jgi:hypothetical protein
MSIIARPDIPDVIAEASAAARSKVGPSSIGTAKSKLLTWADAHDARKLANKPAASMIIAGSAALIAIMAATSLVRAGRNARRFSFARRLITLSMLSRIAIWAWPLVQHLRKNRSQARS